MIGTIISIYLIVMLIMCFIKLRVGIAMFLFYQMLVPFVSINLGHLQLGSNFVNLIVFLSLFISYSSRIKYFEYKSLLPFLFLYLAQLVLIPFHTKVPLDVQLNFFRLDIMSYLLLPFAMINVMKFDKDAYKLFRNVLIICVFIAVVYGLFLTLMPGINPWLIMILPFNNEEFNNTYALADGGRMFGRISSVFSDTQAFGLVLSLSFVFIYSFIKPHAKNLTNYLFLGLIVITIFICGIRSPIGSLVISVLFYLIMERKFKLFIYSAIAGVVIYFIIIQFPSMALYIASIFDSNSGNVHGSSNSMRLEQLNGCLKIIKGNELTGMGYGWTSNYLETKGFHPVLFAFESLFYLVLCNNGFIGVLIWIIMIIMFYRYAIKNVNINSLNIILTLFVGYLTYTLITGDYGYMKYFLIFYVLIIAGQRKSKVIIKRNNQPLKSTKI